MKAASSKFEKVTVPSITERKPGPGLPLSRKITALTAYDYSLARLFDEAGIDIILVGDSVASVVQGHKNTLPVTLDEMIYHSRCVTRGATRALIVGDLPFLSYQVSIPQAIESAGRFLKEGGVAAVKLEGGIHQKATIEALVNVDIPVVGHVGLTPQSYHRMGGHKIQGRKKTKDKFEAGSHERIIEDAKAVEEAGAFCVVIEGVPHELAEEITSILAIPTIGIGAGSSCDGQILVGPDMLGMAKDFNPKFLKKYADLSSIITEAAARYITEVQKEVFPAAEHTVHLSDEERSKSRLRMIRR